MHTKHSITGLLTKDPTKLELETVGNELRLAFSEIEFVYLSGHGIAESEIENSMKVRKSSLSERKSRNTAYQGIVLWHAMDGWLQEEKLF